MDTDQSREKENGSASDVVPFHVLARFTPGSQGHHPDKMKYKLIRISGSPIIRISRTPHKIFNPLSIDSLIFPVVPATTMKKMDSGSCADYCRVSLVKLPHEKSFGLQLEQVIRNNNIWYPVHVVNVSGTSSLNPP